MVTRHGGAPGGSKLEGVGVCGEEAEGGNEGGSFECEESDISMPRFVSPIKLSKLGLDSSTSPIIYVPVMELSY